MAMTSYIPPIKRSTSLWLFKAVTLLRIVGIEKNSAKTILGLNIKKSFVALNASGGVNVGVRRFLLKLNKF